MSRRVLAIDDSRTMREMVSFTLKNAGFDVVLAVDGVDGVDKAVGDRFDLVITDINMPQKDGLTLVRELREMDDYRTIPILVLTTEADDRKKAEGRAAGATGWIVKPFDPDKLVNVANKVCP